MKSLNIAINDLCNNRCRTCNIWMHPAKDSVSLETYQQLFTRISTSEIEDCSITGGEPFMHPELVPISKYFISIMPNLQMLFVNTNGTLPKKIKKYVPEISPNVEKLFICVSLEGTEPTHNFIRGVNSYKTVLTSLQTIAELKSQYNNLDGIVSTTISADNQRMPELMHAAAIAKAYQLGHTFRMAGTSNIYYDNPGLDIAIDQGFREALIEYISGSRKDDKFLAALVLDLQNQRNNIMTNPDGSIACQAGTSFAFVDAKANIRPCIFSSRVIGDAQKVYEEGPIKDLGKYEPCPCCTECTIYPMLNYGGRK